MITNLHVGSIPQKKVAVISHERSGTHFLMNTIAKNYPYLSSPWWNFDNELGINFHSPTAILNYIKQAHDKSILNILKSHHPIGFFHEIMAYLEEQFHIFYVYRNPFHTLRSNWKLIKYYNTQGWEEGPDTATVHEFVRSEPCGAMLRYQKRQMQSMVHRWQDHVTGWLDYCDSHPDSNVHLVKYEDLDQDYNVIVEKIGQYLQKIPPANPCRPDRRENVIRPQAGQEIRVPDTFTDEDKEFVISIAGELMVSLGYC